MSVFHERMEDYDGFIEYEMYEAWKQGFMRGVFLGGMIGILGIGIVSLSVCLS